MPCLSRIAAHLNQRFAHGGIQLPPADLAQRRRGQLSQSGWSIGYLFGADEQGDYRDDYAHHPVSGDEHRRLRANGERECLPALHGPDPDRDDPAATPCASRAWQAENQRIAALLMAKGFGVPGGAPGVPVRTRGRPSTPPGEAHARPGLVTRAHPGASRVYG